MVDFYHAGLENETELLDRADLPHHPIGGKTPHVRTLNDDLLKAVELAQAGDWEAAHELVQQYEEDSSAAWIHAVLHKIEGDRANSRYWYQRADRLDHVADDPYAELTAIQAELRSRRGD